MDVEYPIFDRIADPEVGPYRYVVGDVVEITSVGNTYNMYEEFFRENGYMHLLPDFIKSAEDGLILSTELHGMHGVIVGRGRNSMNRKNLYVVNLDNGLTTLIGEGGIKISVRSCEIEDISSAEFDGLMGV